MNCTDFLDRFSDWIDGATSGADAVAMERHIRECGTCGRYREVFERGASLVRSLPEPELREDFEPRLVHRLYHVDDERALATHQSAAPPLTVVGIAVLLTALAWAPVLRGGSGDVLLEPIVVDGAPRERSAVRPVLLTPPGSFSTKGDADLDDGLWANTLLYEYSALSRRYDQRARVRRVGEPDR